MERALTILIVEDDPDNRLVVTTLLEHFGYAVLQCEDGEVAVDIVAEEHPDVVLMDVSLPGIDGWTATQRIRDRADTAEIPVIALTGDSMPADVERAGSIGFDGYLTKPYEASALLAEITRVAG